MLSFGMSLLYYLFVDLQISKYRLYKGSILVLYGSIWVVLRLRSSTSLNFFGFLLKVSHHSYSIFPKIKTSARFQGLGTISLELWI